jgi:hypothetical protein
MYSAPEKGEVKEKKSEFEELTKSQISPLLCGRQYR